MSDLVCIRTYSFRPEAELARSVLESRGIESVLMADDAHGVRPMVGLATGGVRLCVRREETEKAIAVLGQAEPENS
ncbi:MAG: DUF2007 domain-containing protein [candidate division WOR-3 bacterium]|nr:MAG: DUF2007 domain-containing protein [candidate division WOR-3 bacterium]